MKVDFETIRYLTAIATQGRSDKAAQYVTAYRLMYSTNCVDFTTYNETSGADKVYNYTMSYLKFDPTNVLICCVRYFS